MFFDVAVFAGLATVGLMFAFFGGIGWFIRSDIRKHKAQQ
ncbi:MAG: cytochrome c oxidase subunit CcoM [Pseudomonas sp.]